MAVKRQRSDDDEENISKTARRGCNPWDDFENCFDLVLENTWEHHGWQLFKAVRSGSVLPKNYFPPEIERIIGMYSFPLEAFAKLTSPEMITHFPILAQLDEDWKLACPVCESKDLISGASWNQHDTLGVWCTKCNICFYGHRAHLPPPQHWRCACCAKEGKSDEEARQRMLYGVLFSCYGELDHNYQCMQSHLHVNAKFEVVTTNYRQQGRLMLRVSEASVGVKHDSLEDALRKLRDAANPT
jgi:hypothetical protein